VLSKQTVSFTLAGAEHLVVTNSKGVASTTITAPTDAETYEVDVLYAGGSLYARSSQTANLEVAKAATALVYTGATTARPGRKITLSATLTSSGVPVGGRPVTFTLGESTHAAVTDSKGVAKVSTTAPATRATYPMTVTFAGDGSYHGSGTAGTLVVS
jgi:hypothetical protein